MYTNARGPQSLDRATAPAPPRIRVDMTLPVGDVGRLVALESARRQLAEQARPDPPPDRGPNP